MEFMRTGCSDRCRPIWANNWNKATRTTAAACKEAQKWSWGYGDSICWPKLFIYFKRLDSWKSILGAGYLKITDFIFTQQWSRLTLHLSNKQDFAEKGCFTVCQLPFPPVTHSTDIPVVALKCYQLAVSGKLLYLVAALDLWMCLSMCGCLCPLTL